MKIFSNAKRGAQEDKETWGTGRHGGTVEGCMNEVHHARQIGSWIACLRRKEERAQTKLLSVNATESVATGFSSCGSPVPGILVHSCLSRFFPSPRLAKFSWGSGGNTRSQIKARFLPRMRRPIKVKFAAPVGISPPILVLDNRPFIRVRWMESTRRTEFRDASTHIACFLEFSRVLNCQE